MPLFKRNRVTPPAASSSSYGSSVGVQNPQTPMDRLRALERYSSSKIVSVPQSLARSAAFSYDPGKPAVSLDKGKATVQLTKGYDSATAALKKVDLFGLRIAVIVLVDDSGSMMHLYDHGDVQKLLVRTLGFTLNVDKDGEVPMITYGQPNRIVTITQSNYANADKMIQPRFYSTPMTEAFNKALELAKQSGELTLVVNITDGSPDDQITMFNAVVASSGQPVMLKNLAVADVEFLDLLDDMPSTIEIQKDANDNPVTGPDGNLVLYRSTNKDALRYIDNVDSKDVDPFNDSDEVFAEKLADEINPCIEVMARVGILTGVPGYGVEF